MSHTRADCPFCSYEGELTGAALNPARVVHQELMEIDEHLAALEQRVAPITKARRQTVTNLRRALGLETGDPEPVVDLWSA